MITPEEPTLKILHNKKDFVLEEEISAHERMSLKKDGWVSKNVPVSKTDLFSLKYYIKKMKMSSVIIKMIGLKYDHFDDGFFIEKEIKFDVYSSILYDLFSEMKKDHRKEIETLREENKRLLKHNRRMQKRLYEGAAKK